MASCVQPGQPQCGRGTMGAAAGGASGAPGTTGSADVMGKGEGMGMQVQPAGGIGMGIGMATHGSSNGYSGMRMPANP
eukprot:scaffold24355_cov19-Tisochrysis_lutea.AAC.1